MTANLFIGSKFATTSSAGNPLAGGKVYTYAAGTLTPLATYTDYGGASPNANPVILDANGRANIWLGNAAYRFIIKDAADVLAPDGDVDNILSSSYYTDTRIAALLAQLADTASAANGDALVGVNNGDTGEVGRTLHYWIKASRRNLCNFLLTTEIDDGLSGAGSIDISAKFQTAINAAGGKFLEIPEGKWRADNLTSTISNTVLCGLGPATNILLPTAGNTGITISGQFTELRHINMAAAVARTGANFFVDFAAGANRSQLADFNFDGFKGGIRTAAVATLTIQRGTMLNGLAATGVGIRVNAGLDVSIRDIIMDAAAQIFAGIFITAVGDLTIEDCNIVHGGQALYLNPAAGQVVSSVWANNSFFDTSTRGMYVNPNGAGAAVVRCIFDQCWFSSATSEGVLVATAAAGIVNGLDFNECQFFLNGGDGVTVSDTGATNLRFLGGAAAGNTSAGLSFGTNVSEFSVQAMRIGNSHGLGANANGIVVGAGTGANFTLAHNDVRGNTGVGISENATGAGRLIVGNTGDTTTGFATTITVTASPMTYTSGARSEYVSVRAGTVSDIKVSGLTMAVATDREFLLPPGTSMVVTYTVAPTMTKVFQ